MEKNLSLKDIKSFIQTIHFNDLSLKQLSDSLSFSNSWVSEVFRKEVGENFSEYKKRTRIDYAKKLLIETANSISEISGTVGYCDRYYFHKIFKKHTGLTPTGFIS